MLLLLLILFVWLAFSSYEDDAKDGKGKVLTKGTEVEIEGIRRIEGIAGIGGCTDSRDCRGSSGSGGSSGTSGSLLWKQFAWGWQKIIGGCVVLYGKKK